MNVATVEGDPSLEKLTTPADFDARRAMARRAHGPAHRHGLRRPRLRRRRPDHARRDRSPPLRAALPATAMPTSSFMRSPMPCSAPPALAISASISRRPTRNGRARRPTFSSLTRSTWSARSGAIIDHVDCTIIAEEPKVGPHRAAMRERIAEIAGLRDRSGQHQGDDDRGPRLHRPPRRHCRPGGREHPNGTERVTDTLLPDELVDKAREVVEANRAAGRRIAVAESCTGGLVSAALTEIPGSSDVFEAGYVTYSNAAKIARAQGQRRRRRDVRRGQRRDRLGDGARRARGLGRRCRGRDHRHCRPGRRNAVRSRSARWSSPAPSATPTRPRSSPTRNSSTKRPRSGVRLQAALCALDLLMP